MLLGAKKIITRPNSQLFNSFGSCNRIAELSELPTFT